MIDKIIRNDNWIIEVVQYKWGKISFEKADLIIFLHISHFKNIIKRFTLQKLKIQKSKYHVNFSHLKDMFKWEKDYRCYERDEVYQLLEPFKHKTIIAKSIPSTRYIKTSLNELNE